MAPSEKSILSSFLLTPAALSSAITLQQFTALFPRTLQADPQLLSLYRELQHQRAIFIDDVKHNIEEEMERAKSQRRQVAQARKRSLDKGLAGLDRRELLMERELFQLSSKMPVSRPHTLDTIRPEMEDACRKVAIEVEQLESNITATLADLKATIGDLSDLRYGKFNGIEGVAGDVAEEAVKGLQRLEESCKGRQR